MDAVLQPTEPIIKMDLAFQPTEPSVKWTSEQENLLNMLMKQLIPVCRQAIMNQMEEDDETTDTQTTTPENTPPQKPRGRSRPPKSIESTIAPPKRMKSQPAVQPAAESVAENVTKEEETSKHVHHFTEDMDMWLFNHIDTNHRDALLENGELKPLYSKRGEIVSNFNQMQKDKGAIHDFEYPQLIVRWNGHLNPRLTREWSLKDDCILFADCLKREVASRGQNADVKKALELVRVIHSIEQIAARRKLIETFIPDKGAEKKDPKKTEKKKRVLEQMMTKITAWKNTESEKMSADEWQTYLTEMANDEKRLTDTFMTDAVIPISILQHLVLFGLNFKR